VTRTCQATRTRSVESSAVEVRPMGKSTLHEAGVILSDSFWDYPEVVHLLPNETPVVGCFLAI